MSFDVTADAYNRFMGRFSEPLAAQFVDLLDLRAGQQVLDVGCGPGALTSLLLDATDAVSAIDSSVLFVDALHARLPEVDVRQGRAEELPWAADAFDVTVAQLVIHLVRDPARTLAEMTRVTRPGGTVAASVWDHAGGNGPLETFWTSVRDLDPEAHDETGLAGAGEGQLAALFAQAGLGHIESTTLTVRVRFATFEQWWQPYTLGVGPAGSCFRTLDESQRSRLHDRCTQLVPAAPFEITGSAWCVVARA